RGGLRGGAKLSPGGALRRRLDDQQGEPRPVPPAVGTHHGDGARGGPGPGEAGELPLPQYQHQRGPPGRAGGEQGLPRHLLHQQVHDRLRGGLDRGRQSRPVCDPAPRLPRRRPRSHRAPAHLLGSGRPAQALPHRGRPCIPPGRARMIRGIDHLVIAVKDLEAASRAYGELGFTVVPGGRHPVGTYNTLIAFADGSYVELIGFYRDNPDHRWWSALQRGGGLVDYCLQTDDLIGDTASFREAGGDIADRVSQSRVRPDGYQLRWVFSLSRGPHRGVGPFLINDETPREGRVPRAQRHPTDG